MSRHGRAVSAERTPVNPPAPTRLVPLRPRPAKTGRIVGSHGVIWIEGKHDGSIFTTRPGWVGPLKFWKAKRYARRHGIQLEAPPS